MLDSVTPYHFGPSSEKRGIALIRTRDLTR